MRIAVIIILIIAAVSVNDTAISKTTFDLGYSFGSGVAGFDVGDALLLEGGSDYLLLEGGTDKLLLE